MNTENILKQTPLYEAHLALKGRMVEYAGWFMPVLYTGILEESRATRGNVGIFDISHMGRIRVFGDNATAFLQQLTSNDVAALKPSSAHYSLLMNPEGGIIDDIIVYREDRESYLVVINAGNAEKDMAWMRHHVPDNVTIQDQSEATAMIAVQGPQAPEMVARLSGNTMLLERKRFQYATGMLAGVPATFCRTGYTGEDGFELIVPAKQGQVAWNALIEAGAVPCGLGARDALRIEAGYPLYGHEIDETTSPVEAGLMWVVKLDKGDFFGKASIEKIKQAGPQRRLMGLTSSERIIPRQGYTIYAPVDGGGAGESSDNSAASAIGVITSGVFSPTGNHSVAMAYMNVAYAKSGMSVSVAVRDKFAAMTVVQKKSLLEPKAAPEEHSL